MNEFCIQTVRRLGVTDLEKNLIAYNFARIAGTEFIYLCVELYQNYILI